MSHNIAKDEWANIMACMAPGNQKIQAIKEMRTYSALGLKEAKDAVDSVDNYGGYAIGSPAYDKVSRDMAGHLLDKHGITVTGVTGAGNLLNEDFDSGSANLPWMGDSYAPSQISNGEAIVDLLTRILAEQINQTQALKDLIYELTD